MSPHSQDRQPSKFYQLRKRPLFQWNVDVQSVLGTLLAIFAVIGSLYGAYKWSGIEVLTPTQRKVAALEAESGKVLIELHQVETPVAALAQGQIALSGQVRDLGAKLDDMVLVVDARATERTARNSR